MESLPSAFAEARASYQILTVVAVVAAVAYILRPVRSQTDAFPKWGAIEIAIVSYLLGQRGKGLQFYSRIRRYGGSLWGVTASHQVISNLPNTDRFLAQSHSVLDGFPRDWSISRRVFGVENKEYLRQWLQDNERELQKLTESLFINENAATASITRADVPGKAARFVSFSGVKGEQQRWEWSADVKVVTPEIGGTGGVVEANLHALIRDFGACTSIPQLYGQDFLDRNETLLDDFWKFDNDLFPLLVIGVPEWAPLKMVKDGVAARNRIVDCLRGMYTRTYQHLNGEAVDLGVDMSDISSVVTGRAKLFSAGNISPYYAAEIEIGNIWGQNANTQPLVFWFLLHIFSDPELLQAIREEVAPFVVLSSTTPREITSLDVQAVCGRKCPLLKAAMFECFRLFNQPTSIRYVRQPITIKDGAQEHHMKAGSWVSVVHSLINKDPQYFADPEEFRPERFLETDADGTKAPRYGKLRPWGSGVGQCKGRVFAEKEILTIGTAVTSLWDIEPVGGKWDLPGTIPGTGVARPTRDVRVTIKRRV